MGAGNGLEFCLIPIPKNQTHFGYNLSTDVQDMDRSSDIDGKQVMEGITVIVREY